MLPSGTDINDIPMLSESSGLNQLQKKGVNISSPQVQHVDKREITNNMQLKNCL